MRKIVKIIIIFFCLYNLQQLLISVNIANAQGIDLGIYPPVFQIQSTPPSSIKTPFFLQNFADSSIDLTISLKPFTAAPSENGDILFLEDLSSFPDPSLLQKISVLDDGAAIQSLTLAPKQKKELSLEIELPKDQAKGDYNISLLFSSNKQDSIKSNSSQVTAGIASNILLSIGPLGETKGYIEDFSAPPFVTQGPLPFTVRVKNTSDHYITPKGDIVIKNMFGQSVGKVDLLSVNILPNTVRRMPDSAQSGTNSKTYEEIKATIDKNLHPVAIWPEKFLLGPYTASLTIALSDTGPLYKRTIMFFAFPTEYLIGILVIITIIIFIALRVRQKSREA